jgi:hypothetical protein
VLALGMEQEAAGWRKSVAIARCWMRKPADQAPREVARHWDPMTGPCRSACWSAISRAPTSSKSSHARSARRERRTRVTDEQAAKFVGYRLRRARTHLDNLREFSTLRRELLDGKRWRATSPPRIAIRDDEGENLAADRTVRLRAIQVIEGSEGKGGGVNVNQTSNVATITPG